MSIKFTNNIDLNANQILNGRFQSLTADPSTNLFDGWIIYRSDLDCLKICDGATWRVVLKSVVSGGTHSAALSVSESGGAITITPNLATGSNAGLLSTAFFSDLNASTASPTVSTLVKRDASGRFQAVDPSADGDVATKSYVDAARAGLDVKQSVRVATTTTLTLTGAATVDGVTVVTGDRVLVKDQSTASQNGIYSANTAGVWSRSTDADSSAEVTAGMFVFVSEGTVHADSGWVLTTNDAIVLNTTALSFAQFSGAGQIVAGAGLTKTGNTLDVVGTNNRITVNADSVDIASTYVGQNTITTLGTITTGTWTGTDIAVADGGTGASTVDAARTNLANTTAGFTTSTPVLARISSQSIGNATDLSFVITHNFGTKDVIVQVYEIATNETIFTDVARSSTNAITVTFSSAPASNAYRVVITG